MYTLTRPSLKENNDDISIPLGNIQIMTEQRGFKAQSTFQWEVVTMRKNHRKTAAAEI